MSKKSTSSDVEALSIRQIRKLARECLYFHRPATILKKPKGQDTEFWEKLQIDSSDYHGMSVFIPGKYFWRGKARVWYISFEDIEFYEKYSFEYAPKIVNVGT